MIRNTHQLAPQHTVIAYSDNASVMEGHQVERFVAKWPQALVNQALIAIKKVALPSIC